VKKRNNLSIELNSFKSLINNSLLISKTTSPLSITLCHTVLA
jgi:hypothetical protein